MIPFQDPLPIFISVKIDVYPNFQSARLNLRVEKSTPSVLPLPVIHTSSLADAQVLASFTSSQVNTGTIIYESSRIKKNS